MENIIRSHGLTTKTAVIGMAASALMSFNQLNTEPTSAEQQSVESLALQTLGTWAVSYSCQTDIFSVSAQNPANSNYKIDISSITNNTSATVREFDSVDQPNLDMQIPMAEAEALGITEDKYTSIDVIDTLNAGNVVVGAVVDTVGCPKEPEPTPNPTVTIEPAPIFPITPIPEPTPTNTETPRQVQQVKLPNKKYKVGKTIKMPMRTKAGAPVSWSTYKKKNKNGKRVCLSRNKIIRVVDGSPVLKTKIKTLHPGQCRYQVYSPGFPGDEVLAKKGSFKVVKKN